nr:hypothetical protein [Actinomycetota bacterium]
MRRTVAFLLMAIVLGAGAGAFACTNISTLNISDSSGRPGDRVLVTGTSFGNSSPTGRRTATPLPVRVRWNAVEGPTLAELAPDAAGNISASITIPDAGPGRYVLFAVQQDADGYHMYGTPARIAYEVLTPDGRSAPPTEAAAVSSSAGGASSSLPAALVVLGTLGGALFVAGFVSFARLLKPGERPAAS